MRRRPLLALPLLLALPRLTPPVDAGELRIAGPGVAALVPVLRRVAGVPVRMVAGDAAVALERGHLELALLPVRDLERAHRAMGARLCPICPVPGGTAVTRYALPDDTRRAIQAALTQSLAA